MIDLDTVDEVLEEVEEAGLDVDGAVEHYIDESWRLLRDQERTRHFHKERLRREWGSALDLLGRMYVLSLETGRRFNGECRSTEAEGPKAELFDVITRLHGRACLVSSEILTLLETGHASGAHARWRTLYETVVVLLFIAEGGNEVAKRYLLHEQITSAEAAEEYQQYRADLGLEPLSDKIRKEMREEYEELKSEYTGVYATDYGWAAEELKQQGFEHGGRPILHHLSEAVELDHLKPYYTLANHSVHADSKAINFDLGKMEEGPDMILSGPSNYGLAAPANCTATLLESSVLPFLTYAARRMEEDEEAPDEITSEILEVALSMKAIVELSKKCQAKFVEIQERIEERERNMDE